VGSNVGRCVGSLEGVCVGTKLGCSVEGNGVGALEGSKLGWSVVGKDDGEFVGSVEGSFVGIGLLRRFGVGAGEGTPPSGPGAACGEVVGSATGARDGI